MPLLPLLCDYWYSYVDDDDSFGRKAAPLERYMRADWSGSPDGDLRRLNGPVHLFVLAVASLQQLTDHSLNPRQLV